jgi:copper chaperone NosL
VTTRRALLLALLALPAACENLDQPLAPAWGKQRCGSCSMVVGDRRFAGQAVGEHDDRLFFDDPGCLATYVAAHPRARRAWVMSQGTWLEAKAARFATGASSPMDYGFEAVAGGGLDWAAVTSAAQARTAPGARP